MQEATIPQRQMRWLGGFAIEWDGQCLSSTGDAKADALLIYLLAHPHPHPRETLAAMLWQGIAHEEALTHLNECLHTLHTWFAPQLDTNHQDVAWSGDVPTDVKALVDGCETFVAMEPPQQLTSAESNALAATLSLYQGELLAGFQVPDAGPFMGWIEAERERLQQWAIAGGKVLIRALLDQRQYAQALEWANKSLQWDEHQEDVHSAILECLTRQGQAQAALSHYERFATLIEGQLSAQAGETIASLHRRIQRALRRASTPLQAHPHHPFVGRRREQQQLTTQLQQPECRLLTLWGPGGIGKSSLALHTLQQMLDQDTRDPLHQIVAVHLAAPASLTQLECSLLHALGLQSEPGTQHQDRLLQFLQDKDMVLLLDGFQAYLQCDGAQWLQAMVGQTPSTIWLVTSREPLNIPEEWPFPLQGMAYQAPPTTQEATAPLPTEAMQLLEALAAPQQPAGMSAQTQAAASQLCQLLQGHPLALELAVPWLVSPDTQAFVPTLQQKITAQATQGPPSTSPAHLPIHALLATIWDQLTDDQHAALHRLSLFVADFSWDAALEATQSSTETMRSLREKHLLYQTEAAPERFRLHNMVREYAQSQRAALNIHARMAQEAMLGTFFLRLLAAAEAPLQGAPGQETDTQKATHDQLLQALDREWLQIKEAWRWAVRTAQMDKLIAAGIGLYLYASVRRRFVEAFGLFEEARIHLLDAPAPPGLNHTNALPPSLCQDMATLLLYTSSFAKRLFHHDLAWRTLERAQALLQGIEAPEIRKFLAFLRFRYATQSTTQNNEQGNEQGNEPDNTQAQVDALLPTLHEALNSPSAPWLHDAICNELAREYGRQGEWHKARSLHQRILTHGNNTKSLFRQRRTLHDLARIERATGQLQQARELYEQSLTLAETWKDQKGISLAMSQLAGIACLHGDFPKAQRLSHEALLLAETIFERECLATAHHTRAEIAWALGQFNVAEAAMEQALQQAQQQQTPNTDQLLLQKMRAWIYWAQGELLRGREIADQALVDARAQQQIALVGQLQIIRGWLLRSFHMTQQAHTCFQEAIQLLEQADHPIDVPLAHSGWGLSPDITGPAVDRAHKRFEQGLEIAAKHQLWPQYCHVLLEQTALTLYTTDQASQPITRLHQLLNHPKTWAITRREIQRLLEQWQPTLTKEALAAALQAASAPLVLPPSTTPPS